MTLHTIAKTLHEQGFSVIPTNNRKQPLDQGWQHLKDEGRVEPNGNFDNRASGVGVPCGQRVEGGYLNALDVDCYNKEVSRHLCSFIAELIGHPVPYRVGTAPKFLVPFIHDESIRKRTSKAWHDGQRDHKGKLIESRIEVLGDGQQFVAYGEANGVPYRWFNGELDRTSLPRLTDHQLQQVTDEFYRLAEAHHMSQSDDADPFSGEAGVEDDPFISAQKPPLEDFDTDKVKNLLRAYPAEGLDYDRWVETGMALSHQYNNEPEGYGLWLKWSKPSSKFDPREMPTKWRSFKNEGRQVTLATIIKRAKARQGKEKAKQERKARGGRIAVGTDTQSALRPIPWVVRGIVEANAVGVLYGWSGVGKSFYLIDMALCIAYGVDFHGHKVREPRKVVYMAGEGMNGLRRRIAAWKLERGLQHDTSCENFAIVNPMPTFADDDDISELTDELKAMGFESPALVIVDTAATATAGMDENSSTDMGLFISKCSTLGRNLNGSSVAIAHHTSKAGNDPRGSGVFTCNVDFSFHIEATEGGGFQVICKKMKDAELFPTQCYRLCRINFGVLDEEGDEIYSAVVTPDEDADPDASSRGGRGKEKDTDNSLRLKTCIDSLKARDMIAAMSDDAICSEFGLDAPVEGFCIEELRSEFHARDPDYDASDKKARDACNRRFKYAISKLHKQEYAIFRDEVLYVF